MAFPQFLLPRDIEPGTRQASVFGVGISFMAFIFIVICLRMYVRIRLINAVGVDDSKLPWSVISQRTNLTDFSY